MKEELEHTDIITSKQHWNELITDNTLVYATWEWGSVCEDFGHKRYYLGIQKDDKLVAGLPLMYVKSRIFNDELVSMPYSPYGQIIIQNDLDQRKYTEWLLEDLKSLSDDLGVSHSTIRGYGSDVSVEEFESVSRFVTFEVDLTGGEDDVWESVESRFRRSVKKSKKEDVQVERGFDEKTFNEYYDMYLNNMRFYGTPPYSRQFFHNVHRYLSERDAFEMYLAYDSDGRPINGITIFFHGNRAIYWTGVSDYEYRDLQGGSRLLWEAIQDSCKRGFDFFDLSRTREDTGVYDYKKSIGEPIDLVDIHYAPSGELNLTNPESDTYEKIKTVWRKMPIKATEYIGPHVRKRLTL